MTYFLGLQAVERSQSAVLIVSNLPVHSNVGPIYLFLASRPCRPAGLVALLLTKLGDVETNPGTITLNKQVWICDICHKQIHVRQQISIRCNRIEHWVHFRCAGTIHRYLPSTQIIQTHNSYRHNTNPALQTLVQAPYPLHTDTKTQMHVKHSPCSHRIGKPNALINSPPYPPTLTRAKHIHMLHTPPTPHSSQARHLY